MHADQRVLRRHAAVVATAVLCLHFAARVDGHEVYPTAAAASEMLEPLTVKPDAQQYVQNPEVMPVVPLFTEPGSQQEPELVPVPQLITNTGAAAAEATDGAYSQLNEPVPSTAEGEGYGIATTTPRWPWNDQSDTQPSASSESEAAPATDQNQSDAIQPSPSSYGAIPATGQVDADGEPTEGLSPKAIANIVKEHNVFRAREHVPPLKWNATVAAYAQHYAEERKGDCALEHSTGPYGENLMYGQGKAWTWKHTVDDWSEEKKSYHYGSNTCDQGKMCGHYTAVVWKGTTDVGCGRVTCASGDTLMVCSYWPPGNYDGKKPY